MRTLQNMVRRNLSITHRFICVTDETIDGVETFPMDWSKHVPGTCLVKLMVHKPEIARQLGDRILALDIDVVITGSLDKLVARQEDFIIWANPNFPAPLRAYFQGSVQMFNAGARPELYYDFDPKETLKWLNWRFGGREQCWISERLEWGRTATFSDQDGIYGAGRLGGKGVRSNLPDNAVIVSFPGAREPSQAAVQEQHPWVREHYY